MSCKKEEKGQALVEFALVISMLLILVLGIVEFGRVFHAKQVITSAAREGARTATVTGIVKTEQDAKYINAAIKNSVVTLSSTVIRKTETEIKSGYPEDGSIWYAIVYDKNNPKTGDELKVYVKGTVDVVSPIISNILGKKKVIMEEAVMRIENDAKPKNT